MLVPTTVDILKNLEHYFEHEIKPAVAGTPRHTTAQTMGHLLRHARHRVEHEGQLLLDEAGRLRGLLAAIETYLRTLGAKAETEAGRALLETVADIGKKRFRDAAQYPTLSSMADEVRQLREPLYDALRFLQRIRDGHCDEPGYQAIRADIRAYIAWQVQAEAAMVDPAFVGFGPRR